MAGGQRGLLAAMASVGVFEAMRRATEVRGAIIASAQRHGATVGQTFRAFDRDGDGVIAPLEMLHGLRSLHVPEALDFLMDLEAAVSLVESFDLDHDGRLTEQDWRDYFRQPTPDQQRPPAQHRQQQQLPQQQRQQQQQRGGASPRQISLEPEVQLAADLPIGIGRTASEDARVDDIRRMSSTHEWHDSLREYEMGIELGTGAFGKVHLWTEKSTGRRFACKKIVSLHLRLYHRENIKGKPQCDAVALSKFSSAPPGVWIFPERFLAVAEQAGARRCGYDHSRTRDLSAAGAGSPEYREAPPGVRYAVQALHAP